MPEQAERKPDRKEIAELKHHGYRALSFLSLVLENETDGQQTAGAWRAFIALYEAANELAAAEK